MPKVLRILNRFNLGGPTYNAAYLTKYMAPDFETLLIGGANEETEQNSEYIVRNLGVRPFIIPEMKRALSPKNDLITYNKIKAIIRKIKPDIVHTHASKAGALGRLAAHNMKVPVIVHTFHGHVFDAYFSSAKTAFYKTIEKKLAQRTSQIIAISEIQKYDLINTYNICNEDKVTVIPLGFDLAKFQENQTEKRNFFRHEFGIKDNELAIGIIGRLVPVKNHKLFIDAFNYAKNNTNQKIKAFIVGDGEERNNIETYANSLNLKITNCINRNDDADVFFTSWQKDVDVVSAGMDIIALSSLNEGTPVSLIEAQAANKPIVTTNVGGIENVVIPDKTALLSPNNNTEIFSLNLNTLVNNEKLRIELANNGWDFVKEKFHYTRLVNDMKNLYFSLLK